MLFTVLAHIVTATPIWVFFFFAYLMVQGIQRLQPRVNAIARVAIVPVLFIAWGLIGLFSRPIGIELVASIWGVAALAGIALGVLASPRRLVVDRARRLVRQPGSLLPLVRYLLIFGSHYALNIAMALRPDIKDMLIMADIAVSGIGAGYFAGWIVTFLRTLKTAPEADLSAAATTPVPEAAQ